MSQMIGLQVQTRRVTPLTAVVALQGEMDVYTTPRVKVELQRLLDDGCLHLILDLRRAAYLDSSALGALLGAQRCARERGGGVALVAPAPPITRVLEITRLGMAFAIYATEREALATVERSDGGA
jgi:anti-anti-sigma factor